MALTAYRKKRNFKATAEPRGGRVKTSSGRSFVVQKHDARRLHYDFRLELDGTLLSWAVTRGPSLVPTEKRLAVHVEDHPLEYASFEGTIPKGEYGGGTVIVWDRGDWEPLFDPHAGLKKGHLEFELKGEKLKGRWHLVRLKGRAREKRDNWLLIKGDDAEARGPDDPDILEERPGSVKTGRTVGEVEHEKPGWSSKTGKIDRPPPIDAAKVKGAKKASLAAFVEPCLATARDKPPAGGRFVHEIKFDGYRLQARLDKGRLKLLTRTGLDWTEKFGKALAGDLAGLNADDFLIDGELVVETDKGASNFSFLQEDLSAGRSDRFVYYAFDLLHLNGHDLTGATLTERKQALDLLLAGAPDRIRLSAHFTEDGAAVLRHACRLGLEGIVSKRTDSRYRSGRGKDWLKAKCTLAQEFVIGGYVPSTVSKRAIGSLVLGLYEKGKLVHVGRVGTGFSRSVAEDLFARLDRRRRQTSPFAGRLTREQGKDVRYVKPELVAEVEFRTWTSDRIVRHASFRGLREDKPADEVGFEAAVTPKSADASSAPKHRVKLTHPDRLYWPEEGVTKEGLADYYASVWDWIAPFITKRPLALLRCPGGIKDECFFQKHAWQGLAKAIRTSKDPDGGETMLSIDSLDGLVSLVQSGVLEIHPWGSTLAAIEKPDTIVMDLDPGDGVAWQAVIDGALAVKARFEAAGLASFVKTTGGKGLHVVAPLKPQAEWPAVKDFAHAIAKAMAADDPDRYVATISKAKRKGRILIDYLRNGRGATAVAPYSTRARPGAAVSMPLDWDELDAGIGPAHFTVMNAAAHLARRSAPPWADFRKTAKPLPKGKGTR